MLSKNYTNIIILLLYFSLIFGFYNGENLIGGALSDYQGHYHISKKFSEDFKNTFLNYNELGHRHSPFFYIIRSLVSEVEFVQRIFFLHLYLLIPLFFYKSLKLIFKKENKDYLKLFSSIIFLFPTFRSYSIWPDPHLLGILFFIIAIYFFLKFKNRDKPFKNAILNTLFLSLSSYASPNFGVFVVFFFYEYFLYFKFSKKIIYISLINIFLSMPFFYYLLVLKVNFLFNDSIWDIGDNFYSLMNLSNKFIIISSIFLFYLLPLIDYKKLARELMFLLKIDLKKLFTYFLSFFIIFSISQSYDLTKSGGGIFYNLSIYFLKIICFFFL